MLEYISFISKLCTDLLSGWLYIILIFKCLVLYWTSKHAKPYHRCQCPLERRFLWARMWCSERSEEPISSPIFSTDISSPAKRYPVLSATKEYRAHTSHCEGNTGYLFSKSSERHKSWEKRQECKLACSKRVKSQRSQLFFKKEQMKSMVSPFEKMLLSKYYTKVTVQAISAFKFSLNVEKVVQA